VIEPPEIWIGRGEERIGPNDFDQFRILHRSGRLDQHDLIWWDGLREWITIDSALAQLGLDEGSTSTAAAPPPLPSTPNFTAFEVPETSTQRGYERASTVRQGNQAKSALYGFVGLILAAALASAAFAFLRMPSMPSFGHASREVAEALAAAAMYKTAYAEYVLSNDKVPNSLEDIGAVNAPYGSLKQVRIDSGTFLLDTSAGQLALQPYRNANYQIWFRCGRAAPPAGMEALGQVDSANATTVENGDLPDDCR